MKNELLIREKLIRADETGELAHAEWPGGWWQPSNSSEAAELLADQCSKCAKDAVMNCTVSVENSSNGDYCPILDRSSVGEAIEWREYAGKIFCMAFVPMDEPVRDTATADMFGEAK